MAEILGIGCSHAPMILNPPEEWGRLREWLYATYNPNYQAPPQVLTELGEDNGLSADRRNHQRIVDAFAVLRDKLHAWNPDVLMVIGDDQAENFKLDNLPTFCLYTGQEVEAYPFHRPVNHINNWGAPPDARYTFRCPSEFAQRLRDHLISEGFDTASSNALKGWEWGLAHAIINPLTFLDPEGRFPLLPLFVNSIGVDLGPGYQPRPTPKRCYELGRGIRRFFDGRSERVAVVASSSWSHNFLTHKFQGCAFDEEFDRRNLELLRQGKGSKLAELAPEELQQSGDHELINWIIALGIIGDKPAEIVDVLDAQLQVSFKVFAHWE
ncbi:MAG: hypothetical protein ACE5IG_06715 [Dehalococcoidia bacterium]